MPALSSLDPRARSVVLQLAACMARADGEVTVDETSALRGLAVALGALDALDALEQSLPSLDAIELDGLGPQERMLAFVGAAWMMLADGIRDRRESELLSHLSSRLGLAPSTARFLVAHARWIRTDSDLPPHREADLVLSEAARRIGSIEARRAA